MGASISTRALSEFEDALQANQTTLKVCDRPLVLIPPAAIAKAIHLRELTLNNTELTTLPASFGCLVLLEWVSPCSSWAMGSF